MPKWTVRDVEVHLDAAVKHAAKEDHRSLNGEVLWLVLAGLAARAAHEGHPPLARIDFTNEGGPSSE